MESISPVVSIIALAVSLFTFWFTILRCGSVCGTHPSFITFRYDSLDKPVAQARISLRTLLFSTGKKGVRIENLLLLVSEGQRSEEFYFWGYGDKDPVRCSSIFVPEIGVVTYHHFNPLPAEKLFWFTDGSYTLEFIAKIIENKRLISLWTIQLEIPAGACDTKIPCESAIFFNWSPKERRYVPSVENRAGKIFSSSILMHS